jgi:quercetin dioxygenase-like cupin family protein
MSFYPDFIKRLPEADIPFKGIRGRLLQAGDHQAVFLDIDPVGELPPHSHGAQWGVVLDGEMALCIGGETRTYRKGDSYFIPAGTVHSATFPTQVKVLDLFAERSRYRPK